MTKQMVEGSIRTLTELHMKVNGKMINNTEAGLKHGQMVLNIRVNIVMGRSMVMVYLNLQMDRRILVSCRIMN
jgi:hypothetical protein